MKAVIDTSSLLALVRYYLPFDKADSLKKLIKEKINTGEVIILDKVVEEFKYLAQGIVIKSLDFLNQKANQVKSTDLLPYPKFFNMMESQFSIQVQRRKLNDIQFESKKKDFLESADAKMLLYCLKEKTELNLDNPFIVSEETSAENDGKVFKKLPALCSLIDVNHHNLPYLFSNYLKINLSDYLK